MEAQNDLMRSLELLKAPPQKKNLILFKKHEGKQRKILCYLKIEFLPTVRISYVSCFEYFDSGKEVC